MTAITLLIGTKKGAFLLDGTPTRDDWHLRGPFCVTWPINHVVGDPATGTIYAGGGNEWFGPAVWKTTDFGATWTHSSEGLAYAEGETPIKSVWSLAMAGPRLYAGVEPAGLFASDDSGGTFSPFAGLQAHPTRPHWQPGGAGLILHSIVPHPADPARLWIGISAVGVFETADAGATWHTRNTGTRCDYEPEGQKYPEFGQCVHCIVMPATASETLYQQNHCGMYRSADGGRSWQSIENGLPSSFGFPAATHPRDANTLFLIPLNGDIAGRYVPDAKAAVWRTRDGGGTWTDLRQGLPQRDAYFGVLRQAMATDTQTPAGVYFGTNTGLLFASADEGESWRCIANFLPPIYSVEVLEHG
jgi:photosystem II stability/assembly factor-like uncharacterized protein